MNRCIVTVATGRYLIGVDRMKNSGFVDVPVLEWRDEMPPGAPSHRQKPYAFKAHALRIAMERGFDSVLWLDACMLPIRSMDPLWEQIERDGHFIPNNGWLNGQWTAMDAYADLGVTWEENWTIKHCVAGIMGFDLRRESGRAFVAEYLRLSGTGAFSGPTWNSNSPNHANKPGAGPCGPPEVLGHRHDQTAASVIAWRLGMGLTDPPELFCYAGGESERTVVIAHGGY